MTEIQEYYQEEIQGRLLPLFEELNFEEIEKIKNTIGFSCWKIKKASKELTNAINKWAESYKKTIKNHEQKILDNSRNKNPKRKI